jgi:hypothetical protein
VARSVNPELLDAVKRYAPTIGLTPKELLGIYSYETGGTLDPWQKGPTTKWGQHRGLIQWGEQQRNQYGVTASTPVAKQVEASLQYLQDRGFRPGMGLAQAYAAVNAGGVSAKHLQARDAAAGGAPGTVLDKVNKQFAPHLARAERLLGGDAGGTTAVASAAPVPMPPRRPAEVAAAPPTSPLPNVGAPDRGILADTPDPFKAIADAAEKRQAEQQAMLAAQQQAQQQAPQAQPMAPPPPEQPQQQVINYAGLIMPRIRRGLLADDYSSGLLGAA